MVDDIKVFDTARRKMAFRGAAGNVFPLKQALVNAGIPESDITAGRRPNDGFVK